MVKHTQTIFQQQPTNCLSVFDHFVWLAFKGLNQVSKPILLSIIILFKTISTGIISRCLEELLHVENLALVGDLLEGLNGI